jgi:hypothetical protein
MSISAGLDRRDQEGNEKQPLAVEPGDQTMKYMIFIKSSEKYRSQPIPQGLMDAMGGFITEGFKTGVLKDTAGLKGSEEGHRFRLSGGKVKRTDGPFTEAKEVVGGYAIIEVKSKEEALKVAEDFMELHRVHWPAFECECEVRPMAEMEA